MYYYYAIDFSVSMNVLPAFVLLNDTALRVAERAL